MKTLLFGAFALLLSANVFAGDIAMRGFASFVAGQSLESDENIYGYEGEMDLNHDSLAAIQFNANLDDGLSATVQLMARGSNDYEANVEWAYVTYEFTDSVQLSAGRMRVPFYYYSDYLDVRYTYPWVQVPQTIYGFRFPGYEGLSLVMNSSLGSFDSMLQLMFGQLEGEILANGVRGEIDAENIGGFNWIVTRDWLTFRLGYFQSSTSIPVEQLEGVVQLIQGYGAFLMVDTTELTDGIVVEDDSGDYLGVAMGIDYNDWLLNLEYVSYGVTNSATAHSDAFYLMAGKRFGDYTPYFTYSNTQGEVDDEFLELVPAGLAMIPIAELGGATIPQVLGGLVVASEVDTDLMMLGLRYDFHPSAALKTEILQQEDISGEVMELFRVGIDLIF